MAYNNVIVEGDLDLRGLNLTRVSLDISLKEMYPSLPDYGILITSPIIITNSVVNGSVYMNGTAFQNITFFDGTKFKGAVFLTLSKFNKSAGFSKAQFSQTADFSAAQFNQTADFLAAQFNQTADFSAAQFHKGPIFFSSHWFLQFIEIEVSFTYMVNFKEAKFNKTADFAEAKFNQIADFSKAQFNQTTDFSATQFDQTSDFWGSKFNQTANFWGSKFNQTADFSNVQFNQTANFWDSRFNQTANFWGSKFNQTADFSGVQFNQESYFEDAGFFHVSFKNSQFSKEAFFDGAQINGTLSLYRTKYDTLNIRWLSIHDLAYDDTAYHLLIQNFNKLGFGDDARECQYSYRCKHREELFRQHKFDSWLFDLLAYATYGYGLRPVRPLGWAAFFIFIGGVFFFLTGSVARSKERPSEKRPLALRKREEKPEGSASIWESLLLSATYFTSGASSIISATPTEFVPIGRGRYVVVILRLLGWIFFVLFLSSLTRTV